MSMMKKLTIYSMSLLAALVVAGCAKETSVSSGVSAKNYFDAWIQVHYSHYPELVPTPLGAYVIEEKEGSGDLVGDYEQSPYILANYVVSLLDGEISSTTYESVAKQLGTYDETDYYGPVVWDRSANALYAGVDEAISGMRVGGTKTTVIPGWLFTGLRYDTPEEYVNNVSGTNQIYQIEIAGIVDDIEKWELDSIGGYLSRHFPEITPADSLKKGFYYVRTQEPSDTTAFPADTTIYINYVAKRLDGQAFDTNIRDTAKFYGLYSSSSTYEPVQINWSGTDEDYTAITMGSSSNSSTVIDGFAYALWNMRPHEAGTSIFYSPLGYGSTGSGSKIPGFSPLRFDIYIVDKED